MASFTSNGHLLCLALLCARVAFAIADASDEDEGWTRWAVLVAGSSGFWNYRHQADVCHAYQLLRKGGLEEHNIVVFMYDDLANNTLNPRPGVIINNPKGEDVYAGVPKDYVGKQVTTENLFAVLLGDKKAIKGGSGKVVNSKPNDRIFIYYSDHGGPGVLGMPNKPYLYAGDFIRVLKQKKESNGFMKMVIYVESCESGSIFDGLLPDNLNIYVTTASNATESSWGTYCPGTDPPPPPEYETCLGDLYSVAWMEDSEMHNLKKETISKQYKRVKKRTLNTKDRFSGSHVMEYGTKSLSNEKVYLYQGFDPCNSNASDDTLPRSLPPSDVVNQRDADLLFLWRMYERSDKTPEKKREILREITETVNHRLHLDNTVDVIGNLIFGGASVLRDVRPSGTPLVDDWDCLKSMVRVFESHCGVLTQYGMKHMRAFANICNRGISKRAMERACVRACGSYTRTSSKWSPSTHGYSA